MAEPPPRPVASTGFPAARDAGASPRLASSPCLARELEEPDPDQAQDVARWRKAERGMQLDARAAMSVTARQALAQALGTELLAFLDARFPDLSGRTLSLYWPIRSEFDLRPLAPALIARGLRLALPVVDPPGAPLVFRPWVPGAAMERGHWNIPVPATPDRVRPDIALAPLVGWDAQGYRLGYGGGYFDRTLAQDPRPFAIGVGAQAARVPTIFPQPHDIRLDAILTEAGPQWSHP